LLKRPENLSEQQEPKLTELLQYEHGANLTGVEVKSGATVPL
jgi:hypothetical protein